MKRSGAIAILTTMLLGFLGWGGNTLVVHAEGIAKLHSETKTTMRLLLRIDDKVDKLLMRE